MIGLAVWSDLVGAPTPATAGHTAVCNIVVGGGTFTLNHDIGPCPGDGLRVESDNAVIDLNGYRILGDGSSSLMQSPNTPRHGDVGIRIEAVSNVKVTDSSTTGGNAGTDCTTEAAGWGTGRILGFDVGIAIAGIDLGVVTFGGGGHTIEKVTIQHNIGIIGSDYGDGVHILDSSNNMVVDNRIVHNGPRSGVTVAETPVATSSTGGGPLTGPGTSDNNLIGRIGTGTQAERSPCDGGNVISDNDLTSGPDCWLGTSNEDDGVRLEAGVTNNKVDNNTVERNGLDGIAIFFGPDYSGVDGSIFPPDHNFSAGNQVRRNRVRDNGFHEFVGTATVDDPYPGTCSWYNNNSWAPGPGWAQQGHRSGDGIRVFGPNAHHNAVNNTIEANTVCGNAASGIRIDGGAKATDPTTATGNRNYVQGNTSGIGWGCAANNRGFARGYDVFDSNKVANLAAGRWPCDQSNGWGTVTANTFGTQNPPYDCIL